MPVFTHEHVRAVKQLYGNATGSSAYERSNREQVALLAQLLAAGHHAHHPGAYVELHNWFPALTSASEAEIWDVSLEPSDFRLTVSREHGYRDDAEEDESRPSATFEAAVDALLRGDIEQLAMQLDGNPELVVSASHWPHRATLLHYATANGVETYRQVVPSNLPDLVTLLIDRGADLNATAFAYGGSRRPLGMLRSSAHPRLAGVSETVEAILIANGAR